jgi:Sialidase-like, CBM domain
MKTRPNPLILAALLSGTLVCWTSTGASPESTPKAAPGVLIVDSRTGHDADPLRYVGPPLPNPKAADGGLRYCPGVQNIEISRANRTHPSNPSFGSADGKGWTYQHHVDLACWRGQLYAAWDMTTGKEDMPPFHVVYSTSTNGFNWSMPQDLFPFNTAWNQRFYFYHASNGRMLAFACGPNPENGNKKISEAIKKTMLVREIGPDHRLGEVYTLIHPGPTHPSIYTACDDEGFVAACREAFNNTLLLEQQDYGVYLGEKRMKWHDATNWPGGNMKTKSFPFGKALCFFHRRDGLLVGLCKMGFATLSADEGRTWSLPVIPTGILAGGGKVWAQRTPDGRYAMIYPPQSRRPRYPMAITTSDDGITFHDMRVIHAEVPLIRYGASRSKGNGPQYLRGIAEWAGDAPGLDTDSIWVIYSVNQEDIWVSRIPVPVVADTRQQVNDNFDNIAPGPRVPGWNTYSPAWAPVCIARDDSHSNQFLELEDREAADYARAIRTFPAGNSIEVSFRVSAAQANSGRLEMELLGEDNARPVRLILDDHGQILCPDGHGTTVAGRYQTNTWIDFRIRVKDARFTVLLNGRTALKDLPFAEPSPMVYALSFRTGEFRGIPQPESEQQRDIPNTDEPSPPLVYRIDDVATRSLN